MKKILGFTEEFTVCDCCGKQDLKGTYCIEIETEETIGTFYYGSVCAFKEHGVTDEEKKAAKAAYKKEQQKKEALLSLEDLLSNKDLSWNTYLQSKVIKFIEKKKIDIRAFLEKNGTLCEETKYYFAYTYGNLANVWMFDKESL